MYINENLTVKEGLLLHYKEADLPMDGGVNDKWFKVKLGPIKIPFPNPKVRRRSVPYHDIHHLVTGYNTVLTQGETEVAAWEIAGGMGDHWLGWWLNMQAIFIGLLFNRKNMYKAYMIGLHCKNTYKYEDPSIFNEYTIRELREKVGILKGDPAITKKDTKRYRRTLWTGVGVALLSRFIVLGLLLLLVLGMIKLY